MKTISLDAKGMEIISVKNGDEELKFTFDENNECLEFEFLEFLITNTTIEITINYQLNLNPLIKNAII